MHCGETWDRSLEKSPLHQFSFMPGQNGHLTRLASSTSDVAAPVIRQSWCNATSCAAQELQATHEPQTGSSTNALLFGDNVFFSLISQPGCI